MFDWAVNMILVELREMQSPLSSYVTHVASGGTLRASNKSVKEIVLMYTLGVMTTKPIPSIERS